MSRAVKAGSSARRSGSESPGTPRVPEETVDAARRSAPAPADPAVAQRALPDILCAACENGA